MSYEDDLAAQARAMIAELQDSLAEIRATTGEILQEAAAQQAEDTARDEERARHARAGDFGPDWRRIQERIDRGETSLGAVVRGGDQSAEAEALRETSIDNLVELRLAMDAEDDASREPVIAIPGAAERSPFALSPEARQSMAQAKESMAALDALKERLASMPLPDAD